MTGPLAILSALLAISAIVASILLVAWLDFDRPRHALTWVITFALLAMLGAIQLGFRIGILPVRAGQLLSIGLGIAAAATNVIGFRQRAGLRPWTMPLLSAGALFTAAAAVMEWRGYNLPAAVLPLDMFEAATFTLAASTLAGRRRSEWAAETFAFAGLAVLALLSSCMVAGKLLELGGVHEPWLFDLAMIVPPLLPAAVTAIGLFTILLLTADLADQTRRMAATDMLTGLLNRRGFEEAAQRLLDQARARGFPLTLAIIDLDRFKEVNDSFGHLAGDDVLIRFARQLAERGGGRNPAARLGGEEFALLMAHADLSAATCSAEMLRAAVAGRDYALPDRRTVTASIGLAELKPEITTLAELLRRADAALYSAKAGGRNRVVSAP